MDKATLGHCKMILEDEGGVRIAINPDKFDKLITSLRTVNFNQNKNYRQIAQEMKMSLRDIGEIVNRAKEEKE